MQKIKSYESQQLNNLSSWTKEQQELHQLICQEFQQDISWWVLEESCNKQKNCKNRLLLPQSMNIKKIAPQNLSFELHLDVEHI